MVLGVVVGDDVVVVSVGVVVAVVVAVSNGINTFQKLINNDFQVPFF